MSNPYKGITIILYNHLNLPYKITFSSGNAIEWVHDANGKKLRKLVKQGATTILTQDYSGDIEYKNGVLEAMYHAEGRVRMVNNTPKYEYVLRDHLGNGRVYFSDSNADGIGSMADISQDNHYYPFGLNIEDPRKVVPGAGSANAYQYNNKELNEDWGLNWSDYGARFYDAAVGRWWTVDPMADSMQDFTIYNYALNNPVRIIDPDGNAPTDVIIRISKTAVGYTQIRLIGSEGINGAPATIEVPIYRMTVTDDVTDKTSEYYVTRDGPVVTSVSGKNFNVDNTAFEPKDAVGHYTGVALQYPHGTNLEAFALRENGKKNLATDKNRGTVTAEGVMIHVGGTYTLTAKNAPPHITGSLGCFGVSGKDAGNAGIKRFVADVVGRRATNIKNHKGGEIRIDIIKRDHVDWNFQVNKNGKKI